MKKLPQIVYRLANECLVKNVWLKWLKIYIFEKITAERAKIKT
jgi:hypothetical protein